MKCAILLATYNGERYIQEQMDSILNQKNTDITIFVSDDSSIDSTMDIINNYGDSRINILPEIGRMGSASQNFFRLIRDVDFDSFDYVAFSDQDDIWKLDKLNHAIVAIEEKKIDAYSSNVIAFWENGNQKIINKAGEEKEYDYLFSSPGPGCTHVFKTSFLQKFKIELSAQQKLSKEIDLHDWVVYAYARCNGHKWWVDPYESIMYRQHNSNEFGANKGFKAFISRWKKARGGWYRNQILKTAEFCNIKDMLPVQYLSSVTYMDKVKLALMVFKFRKKKSEALILALMLLIPGFK